MTEQLKLLIWVVNSWNNLIHNELVSIFSDLFFWLFVCLVGFPLAAAVALLRGVYQVIAFFFGSSDLDPKSNPNEEYAVLITGCDTGFGKELVAPLADRGFTVFCGCLNKESFETYQGNPLVVPILLDVTNDKSVAEAYKSVTTWLNDKSDKKRHFYALVNNAGIARFGLIDWASMDDFKACMEVNYYGMVRTIKEFYPLFKQNTTNNARIINMVSMAGMFQGGDCFTPYGASKHAADCFTVNLRLEMVPHDVHVCCINPTFHSTPMANTNQARVDALWNSLSKEKQEEYGDDFLEEFRLSFSHMQYITWDSKRVVDAMEDCVVARYPTRRALVGIDAKYVFPPLNLLPSGLGFPAIMVWPDCMKQRQNC